MPDRERRTWVLADARMLVSEDNVTRKGQETVIMTEPALALIPVCVTLLSTQVLPSHLGHEQDDKRPVGQPVHSRDGLLFVQ